MRKKNTPVKINVEAETQTDLTLSEMEIILNIVDNYNHKNNSIYVSEMINQTINQTINQITMDEADKIKKEKMKKKIEYLESVYQPEQRTD
jgi:hypothetical protein